MLGPGAFRLFLATMVLVSHVSIGRFGVVSVMVFFILSGYWVTRMYRQKYAVALAPISTFYLSRFLRLWPAFVVAVLVAIAILYAIGDPTGLKQLTVLTMLGAASGKNDPLSISWSLDIEMQFYLLLPWMLLLAHRAGAPTMQFMLVVAVTGAAWVFRAVFHIETALQYLPAFAAGCAIFLFDIKISRRMAMASAALFLILGVILALNSATVGVVFNYPLRTPYVRLASLFWALSLVPFVAWNVRQPGGSFDRALGDFSYSLYLVHFPIAKAVRIWLAPNDSYLVTLIQITASFVGATLFYFLIDRYFERVRGRVLRWYSRSRIPTNQSAASPK